MINLKYYFINLISTSVDFIKNTAQIIYDRQVYSVITHKLHKPEVNRLFWNNWSSKLCFNRTSKFTLKLNENLSMAVFDYSSRVSFRIEIEANFVETWSSGKSLLKMKIYWKSAWRLIRCFLWFQNTLNIITWKGVSSYSEFLRFWKGWSLGRH